VTTPSPPFGSQIQSVALIIKRGATNAVTRAEELTQLSNDSLRADYATAAAAAGGDERKIVNVTRPQHKNLPATSAATAFDDVDDVL
jgi:hypothetical protein